MHNACWARKSASGHTCAWSAAGWRRRAQKPVAARRSHTGAPRRAQALRVRVRCTRGVSHDRPVVSGWPDAAKRGFPVMAVMTRVASDRGGAARVRRASHRERAKTARPAMGTARTRCLACTHAAPGRRPRLPGGWRKTAGSVERGCVSVFAAKNHLVP